MRRAELDNASSSRGETAFQPTSHHPMDLLGHLNTYLKILTRPPHLASLLLPPVFSRARELRNCAGFDLTASSRAPRPVEQAQAAWWAAAQLASQPYSPRVAILPIFA